MKFLDKAQHLWVNEFVITNEIESKKRSIVCITKVSIRLMRVELQINWN